MNGKPMLWKHAIWMLAAAIALSACSGGGKTDETPPAGQDADEGAETPAAPDDTTQTPDSDGVGVEPPAKLEDLPQTTNLEFTVEGEPQSASGTLTESELGYGFYLMEGFVFTPEEPGKDMVFHSDYPEFFLRIEPLPGDSDMERLRATAEETAKAVGDVSDAQETFPDEEIRSKAKFILLGSSPDASVTIMALPVGDAMFRLTLHIPSSEAAEGVTPRFYPMIRSLVPAE